MLQRSEITHLVIAGSTTTKTTKVESLMSKSLNKIDFQIDFDFIDICQRIFDRRSPLN